MTDTKQAVSVEEATEILGDALQNDPRFIEWRAATTALEQDPAMTELMGNYKSLAQKAKDSRHGGPQLSDEEAAEVAKVQKTIQENDLFIKHHETTGVLLEMLRDLNQGISEKIGLDFAAASVKRPASCTG